MAEVSTKDSSEVFTNAEFYHLRNCLVEVVEEVKLRRNNDTESEERIKLLVNEKYKLERTFEGEQGKMSSVLEEHQRQLADMERNCLEKMRLTEEENKQLRIYKKCGEKETDALKDNVRSLQLTKYSLEKNLRDQEHKLQSHLSSSDQQLGEITALEQKIQSMTSHFQQLGTSQDKLAKNVSEAMKLNKSLMFVNEHQKCVLEQQKTDLHQCRQQVIQLNTRLESPTQDSGHLEELQQQLTTLEHQLHIVKNQRETLQKELDDYKTRHKKSLDELHQAHCLVKQHLDNAGQHRDMCRQLELTVVNLRSRVKDTEEQVDKLHQELDVERTLRNEALSKWKQQEESLQGEVDELKNGLECSELARGVLEELNVKLTESNTTLDEQYQAVKAILDMEKRDREQQTSVSLFKMEMCGTQTEKKETSDGSVQTQIDTTSAGVQAVQLSSSSSVQTDKRQYTNSVSQTFVPPLTNTSAQTIISASKDDDFQFQRKQDCEETKDLQEVLVVESSDETSPEADMVTHGNENEQALGISKSLARAPEIENMPERFDDKVTDLTDDVPCEEVNTCSSEIGNQCPDIPIDLTDSSSSVKTMHDTISSSLSVPRVHFQEPTITQAVRIQLPISKHAQKSDFKTRTRLETPEIQTPTRSLDENVSSSKGESFNINSSFTKRDSLEEHTPANQRGSIESNTSSIKRGETLKSRPLYNESPMLWGAHLEAEEPKTSSSRLTSSKDKGVSLLESWATLLTAEEQKKSAAAGRSPRTRLKMGLKILTESSPSRKLSRPESSPLIHQKLSKPDASPFRHQRLTKPVISGLESSESDFQETRRDKNQKRNGNSLEGTAESKCLKLQQDLSATHTCIFNSAERKHVKDNQVKPGKSILKYPWSQKTPKSVRFDNLKTPETTVATNITPKSKSSAEQPTPGSTSDCIGPPQSHPSGEQLLFSDED